MDWLKDGGDGQDGWGWIRDRTGNASGKLSNVQGRPDMNDGGNMALHKAGRNRSANA